MAILTGATMSPAVTPDRFRVRSRWAIEATPGELSVVFRDFEQLVRWHPRTFCSVRNTPLPTAGPIHQRTDVTARGWLPYTCSFSAYVRQSRRHARVLVRVVGDFDGWAVCTARDRDGFIELEIDWRVRVRRRLLRMLVSLAPRLCIENHRRVVAAGVDCINREIAARRRGADGPWRWQDRPRVEAPECAPAAGGSESHSTG